MTGRSFTVVFSPIVTASCSLNEQTENALAEVTSHGLSSVAGYYLQSLGLPEEICTVKVIETISPKQRGKQ